MENCELVGWLEKLDGKIDKISEKQVEIYIQTTKTNGQVTALEEKNKEKKIDGKYTITTLIALCALIITIFLK